MLFQCMEQQFVLMFGRLPYGPHRFRLENPKFSDGSSIPPQGSRLAQSASSRVPISTSASDGRLESRVALLRAGAAEVPRTNRIPRVVQTVMFISETLISIR